jgi:hypothetical protein
MQNILAFWIGMNSKKANKKSLRLALAKNIVNFSTKMSFKKLN